MSVCECCGQRILLNGRDISDLAPVLCNPAAGWVRVLKPTPDSRSGPAGRRVAVKLYGKVERVANSPAPETNLPPASPAPKENLSPAPEPRRWGKRGRGYVGPPVPSGEPEDDSSKVGSIDPPETT